MVLGVVPRSLAPVGVECVAASRKVGAWRKTLVPGQWTNYYSYIIVGVGPVEGVDQLISHHLGERVELVRAAKGDRCYAISDTVVDLRSTVESYLPQAASYGGTGGVGERGESRPGGRVVTSSRPRTNTSLADHASTNQWTIPAASMCLTNAQ